MAVSLELDTTHQYTDAKDGIHVPITLVIGSQSVELVAKLDTGAAHCIFERTFSRNFVGRSGWLDRLRVGIIDYDRMLFVGPYQS
jgi:hypothetical protein